ncbi:hypothetical protein H4S02_000918 [Coemansia sp. RSA 2611]|nr:hypothetical protein H4S02_000918 [Coemansia sp. RSA 2611]
MNCADVEIQGSQASTFTGKEMTLVNYHNYPQMPLSNGNNQAGREYFTTDARIITVLANKDDDHTTTQLPHQELRRRHYKTVVETETEKEMATVTASAPAAAATQDASNNVTGYRHKSHKHKSHRKGSKKGGKCQSCCSCSCGNANANYMPPMYGNSYGYGYYGFQDSQGFAYPQMQQNFNGYSESSQFSYPNGGQNGYYGSNQDGVYGGGQDNYSGGSQYFESGQGGFGDSNQGNQYGGSQSNGQSGYANGYSYYESYGSGDSQNFDQGFSDKAMKMDYVGPIQDDSVDSLFGRAVKESDSK